MGQSVESRSKELLTAKVITLPEARNLEPQVKSPWWNDAHFCDFHQNKGHKTNDYMQLKHLIQDLIDNKTIFVEGLQTNNDHRAFKNPLPNYEKGESSSSNNKGKNVNYVYDTTSLHIEVFDDQTHDKPYLIATDDPINDSILEHEQDMIATENNHHDIDTTPHQINDLVPINLITSITTNDNKINDIKIREKHENSPINAITRGHAKVTLKGANPSTSKATIVVPSTQYNIVDQLKKIPAQISILELLKISLAHKEILEQALVATMVPIKLEVFQFKTMVGHLTVPHCLSFSEHDDVSINHPHNATLHIEVLIHKHCVKCVLIDGGAGLNICTLKLICALGYYENAIDARRKITIKYYDDEERSSQGLISLPVQVGPIVKEIIFQVLDKDLTYNILLGHPWIHQMQVVPSTYHQCLKFPFNKQEITISVDSNNPQYCNTVKTTQDTFVPHNREASMPSSLNNERKSNSM